jgi:hypothetical protein
MNSASLAGKLRMFMLIMARLVMGTIMTAAILMSTGRGFFVTEAVWDKQI